MKKIFSVSLLAISIFSLAQAQNYVPSGAMRLGSEVGRGFTPRSFHHSPGTGQRASYDFFLDYGTTDYVYSVANNYYPYFYYWEINRKYSSGPPNNTSGNYNCKWAAVQFDTLYDVAADTIYSYTGVDITVDSIGLYCNHKKHTAASQKDTLTISVLERANNQLGFTSNDTGKTLTNTVYWDTVIITTTSLTPGVPGSMLGYYQIPCGQLIPTGKHFIIKVDFTGSLQDSFDLADFNHDRCHTRIPAPTAADTIFSSTSVFPLNSWRYLNLFVPGVADYSGIFPLNTVGDTSCNEFYFQNWGITPKVTLTTVFTATVTASQTSVCPGDVVTLSAQGVNGSPGYTYSWSPNTGLSNPNIQSPNATVTATTPYTVTIRDALNDVAFNTITITTNGITVNAGNDQTIQCGQTLNLQATTGGVNTSPQFIWNNGITSSFNQINAAGTYVVTATNSHGCTASDAVIISGVGQLLSFSVNIPNNTGCQNVPITFTNTSPHQVGWNWNWTFGNTATSTATSPIYAYPATGNFTATLNADSASCAGVAASKTLTIQVCTGIVVGITGSANFCEGQSTVLKASTTNATGVVSYMWTGGSTADSLVVTQAGTYWVTATDQNGSDNDQKIVTTNPLPTSSFTFSVAGNTASFFDASSNATGYSWDFGDGSPADNNQHTSHTYANATNYTACHTATNSCGSDDSCQTVTISCAVVATITPSGLVTICNGGDTVLTASTGTGYTYVWYRGTIVLSGETSSTLTVTQAGSYKVEVTSGCTVASLFTDVVISPVPSVSITPAGSTTFCPGGSVVLNATTGFATYHWNTGGNSASITATASGTFTVTVTNASGCQGSSTPFVLNTSSQSAPDICMVTVDNSTNKNVIVWVKPPTSAIDSYAIYKDNVIIGTQSYNDLSTFTDPTSDPSAGSSTYKLGIIDSCGTHTLPGTQHSTINLSATAGTGANWDLAWSHYEGFTFTTYNILRGTLPTALTQIGTVANSTNTYTDATAPAGTVYYYRVDAVKPSACVATSPTTSFAASKSNLFEAVGTGIRNVESPALIRVYPNPFNTSATVEVDNVKGEYDLAVFNMTGVKVFERLGTTDRKFTLEKATLQQGVYFIEIRGKQTIGKEKIVVY